MTEIIFCPSESSELLEYLRMHLHKNTPEYIEAEHSFQKAIQRLRISLKHDASSLLDAYINAEETRISACLNYLFWLGVNQNKKCFLTPSQKIFLNLDFEDICQETVLNSMPEALRCYDIGQTLHKALAESEQRSLEKVTEYYCYLETVGYKLAHYWGFQHGDALLPNEVLGYASNPYVTAAYRRMIHNYLELDPGV